MHLESCGVEALKLGKGANDTSTLNSECYDTTSWQRGCWSPGHD